MTGEARAVGIHRTFTPMVDIACDPRWGRIIEGAGEDPYLGAAVAAAQVRGFQGWQLASSEPVGSESVMAVRSTSPGIRARVGDRSRVDHALGVALSECLFPSLFDRMDPPPIETPVVLVVMDGRPSIGAGLRNTYRRSSTCGTPALGAARRQQTCSSATHHPAASSPSPGHARSARCR